MTNAHLTVGIRRNETIWSAPDEEFDGNKIAAVAESQNAVPEAQKDSPCFLAPLVGLTIRWA